MLAAIYTIISIFKSPHGNTKETRQGARRVIAKHSRDIDEEWPVLNMLGIHDEKH